MVEESSSSPVLSARRQYTLLVRKVNRSTFLVLPKESVQQIFEVTPVIDGVELVQISESRKRSAPVTIR